MRLHISVVCGRDQDKAVRISKAFNEFCRVLQDELPGTPFSCGAGPTDMYNIIEASMDISLPIRAPKLNREPIEITLSNR